MNSYLFKMLSPAKRQERYTKFTLADSIYFIKNKIESNKADKAYISPNEYVMFELNKNVENTRENKLLQIITLSMIKNGLLLN